ncbi:DUF3105 domain-containing protein [uncultured Pseudokineococcus sp.]|uniref:DUF3105 domain-containing protein n=1 Tax=uncultured Pseudokineococcus sp. TaxID=1642928 RepID=UPI00260257B9|nr:DUF3105 domain-containing protein [uncultured Pseudokineococcus sp.]
MAQSTSPREERAARAAALREQQRRKERRQRGLIIGITAAVIAALVAAVAFVLVTTQSQREEEQAALEAPIDGVQTFEDLGRDHVTGAVDYAQTPPVGGDHQAVWWNCGVYPEPVVDENAVHSMEHGAVWITHDPALPQEQVDQLVAAAESYDYTLVSPYEGMESPITLSAWGAQLAVEDASDERIAPFLAQYVQGEQTPEPGAACTGGVS